MNIFSRIIKKIKLVSNRKKFVGIFYSDLKKLNKLKSKEKGSVNFFSTKLLITDKKGFLHSLEEIFMTEVYKFISNIDNPYIIDCGANVGLSVIYFKKYYPEAEILAFEPDGDIFNMLKKNLETFNLCKKVEIRQEAVYVSDTLLTFYSDGSLAGSTMVDYAGLENNTIVKAIDFNRYLNRTIDFLKIDIEGAENELIFHIKDNLKYVNNLFLEYHGLLNQRQNLGDILNLLSEVGFEYYIRVAGETMKFPFCQEKPKGYNQQLNIFCYRLKDNFMLEKD